MAAVYWLQCAEVSFHLFFFLFFSFFPSRGSHENSPPGTGEARRGRRRTLEYSTRLPIIRRPSAAVRTTLGQCTVPRIMQFTGICDSADRVLTNVTRLLLAPPQGLAALPCQTLGGFGTTSRVSHIHPGDVRDELRVAAPYSQLRAA